MYKSKLFDIPPVSYFTTKNYFNGSCNDLNFDIIPVNEEKELEVKIWRGKYKMSLSEISDTAIFPATQDGVDEVKKWLEAKL